MFRHILLATDGSAASEHAAQMAVQLARVHDAKLTALYVVDPYPYLGIGEANPMGFQAYMSAAYEHAAQAHRKIAEQVYLAADCGKVMQELGQVAPTETRKVHVIMGKTFDYTKPEEYIQSFAIRKV